MSTVWVHPVMTQFTYCLSTSLQLYKAMNFVTAERLTRTDRYIYMKNLVQNFVGFSFLTIQFWMFIIHI